MNTDIYQSQVFIREVGRHGDDDEPEPLSTGPGPPPTERSGLPLHTPKVDAETERNLCNEGPET